MLVSGIFKQLTTFVVIPDVEGSVFYFRWRVWRKHQSKLYWAWRLVSVWENEPKLKDTTVNHFALRREIDITGRLKSIYVRTVSQRNNTPEPYGFLFLFSFSRQVWLLSPTFFPNIPTSSDELRKLKTKIIFHLCLNLLFFLPFLFWLFLFHDRCDSLI